MLIAYDPRIDVGVYERICLSIDDLTLWIDPKLNGWPHVEAYGWDFVTHVRSRLDRAEYDRMLLL